jgi:hypothetical protein
MAVCVVVALGAHVGGARLKGSEPAFNVGPPPRPANIKALVVGLQVDKGKTSVIPSSKCLR